MEDEDCLVAACCTHSSQPQPSKPTNELIGVGGPGKRNATQLPNIICHLQGCMASEQVVDMLHCSQEFHDKWCETDCVPTEGNKGDEEFAVKWNRVRCFRDFKPMGKQDKWKRCPQCILTRWQCIGGASQCGHEHCLVLLKFAQLCVNGHKADNKVNGVASELQSLLIGPFFAVMCAFCFAFMSVTSGPRCHG